MVCEAERNVDKKHELWDKQEMIREKSFVTHTFENVRVAFLAEIRLRCINLNHFMQRE